MRAIEYIFDRGSHAEGHLRLRLLHPVVPLHRLPGPSLSVGHFSADRFEPAEVEATGPEPRVPARAARRHVLGGATRRGVHRRDDSGGREDGPGTRTPPRKSTSPTPSSRAATPSVRAWLTDVNPVVDPALDAVGHADVRQRRRQRRRRPGARRLPGRLARLRQRRPYGYANRRGYDRRRATGIRTRDASRRTRGLRPRGHQRRRRRSRLGEAGARLLPPRGGWMATGRVRTPARLTGALKDRRTVDAG